MRYLFLGDRLTRSNLKNQPCDPVRRPDGKCVVGINMATAYVEFSDGNRHVVPRRRLRLQSKLKPEKRNLYGTKPPKPAIKAKYSSL